MAAATYLFDQTTTRPVVGLEGRVREAGFVKVHVERLDQGSFLIVSGRKEKHETLTCRLYVRDTALRMVPHRVETGLVAIGKPGRDSPVLLTGNFALTVAAYAKCCAVRTPGCWSQTAGASTYGVQPGEATSPTTTLFP